MHLGTHLKIERIKKGLTQDELAELVHKTRPLISSIEQYGRGGHETLRKVCKALDLDPEIIEHYAENPGVEYIPKTTTNNNQVISNSNESERNIQDEYIQVLRDLLHAKDLIIESLNEKIAQLSKK